MATPEQAAEELALLGRRLKAADKSLRKGLLREIRAEGKPVIEDIRAGIHPTFPNRGGLADRVKAAKIGVRTRLAGKSVGVRLQVTGPKNQLRTLAKINDSGSWRHPVMGNRKVWVAQTYGPSGGWFDEPIEDDLPRFRKAIEQAIEKTASEITRGI